MSARFIPADYDGGRIVLMSGRIDVGAVFPPVGNNPGRYPWSWRMWIRFPHSKEGRAATEQAAKNALIAAWRDLLTAADLTETPPEEGDL